MSGNWGGLILLGRGYVSNNTAAGPDAAREVQIEGLTAAGGLGLYGNCAAAYPSPYGKVCDDDDSGSLSYVSVRYGGFNLNGQQRDQRDHAGSRRALDRPRPPRGLPDPRTT